MMVQVASSASTGTSESSQTSEFDLYGVSDKGTWIVYPPAEDHAGFGPFADRDEVIAFLLRISAGSRGRYYAVNLSDYPNWHNV